MYSTEEASHNGRIAGESENSIAKEEDLIGRVKKLEKANSTMIHLLNSILTVYKSFTVPVEEGFKDMEAKLTESLEKSLRTTNDGIKDRHVWIVGIIGIGVRRRRTLATCL